MVIVRLAAIIFDGPVTSPVKISGLRNLPYGRIARILPIRHIGLPYQSHLHEILLARADELADNCPATIKVRIALPRLKCSPV